MKKILFIALIAFGAVTWYQKQNQVNEGTGITHTRLIMYSQTTCSFCKKKAEELQRAGIRYTEYYIDKDRQKRDELTEKLKQAGFKPMGYGTPIFDAYGTMLPNNPDLSKIIEIRNRVIHGTK